MALKTFRIYLESGATFTVKAASYTIEADEVVFKDENGNVLNDFYVSSSLAVAIVPVDTKTESKKAPHNPKLARSLN